MTILVVDDDPDLRDCYALLLTMRGHRVITARDGAEALERLGERPDVVLTDIEMPRVNGLRLLEELRRLGVPAVANSGSGSFREQALSAGAHIFLEKPATPNALFEALEFLGNRAAA